MDSSNFKTLLMSILVALLPLCAWAQNIDVRGVVVDEFDEPVIGANVAVTGTKMQVLTDYDGKFEFKNINTKTNKTLTVSYVGMETAVADIASQMHIVLHSVSELLDDVVVVAFGKQKREAFTGSAAVVKSEDIVKRQANNPIKAIEGKVPGLTMLSSNSPTSENTINIRGLSSINASTSPLIVLDGQPYNGSLRDINPADVDNISVLKDAASNALYGARGANGVIMITTKNAKKGATKVSIDMKWGANTDALVDYDVIDNPAEYYEAHYLALRNYYTRALGMGAAEAHLQANMTMRGSDTDAGGLGYILYAVPDGQTLIGYNGRLNPQAVLGNRVYNNGQVYTLYPDDWRANGLRNGFRQEYNVNLSGGADNYSTYISLGYLEDNGISYGSDLKRYSARLKTDYQAYSWLKVGANASYSHAEYNNMNESFSTVHNLAPIYPLYLRDQYGHVMYDQNGPMYDYGDGTLGFVRVTEKNSNSLQGDRLDVSKTSTNAFTINGYANIDLVYGLKLTVNGSVQFNESRSNTAYNPYYGYFSATGGSTSASQSRRTSTNFQQLLNWDHKYGRSTVELLLGHEYHRYNSASISGSKTQIAIFEDNIELDGAIINGSIGSSTSMYNVEGYFARAQYDYDNRWFASASFRRDGSSRFHPDHRWGNFWSLGAAWIISKEEWFTKSPMINMLKIKASFGQQGNDGLGSSFYWTDFYDIQNSNDQVAYSFSWKGNKDITWETNTNFNCGVEFGLFNNRLSGTVEFYDRKTSDMLYYKTVPSSLGYTGYYDNIGDMVNRGVEVTLNGTVIRTRDISWSIDLNFAAERNRVTRLPESSKGQSLDGHKGYQGSYYFYGEDLPLYTWYIPRYAGPNDSGQPTWYKNDGNGGETLTTVYDQATLYNCGTALPKMYGGFGTVLSAYGFDLSASFIFTVGGKKLDNGYLSLMGSPYGSTIGMNIHRDALNGWSETNPDAVLPRWQYNDVQNNLVSDYFLIDGSQLTFKSCQLGYTIPAKITKAIRAQQLRLYFSVDNVCYWTKRKGFDPRGGRTTYNGTGYSPMRTFVGGLNIAF